MGRRKSKREKQAEEPPPARDMGDEEEEGVVWEGDDAEGGYAEGQEGEEQYEEDEDTDGGEEEDSEGSEGGEDASVGGSSRKAKRRKVGGQAEVVPTAEELAMLKQTSALFKSNLFKLQMTGDHSRSLPFLSSLLFLSARRVVWCFFFFSCVMILSSAIHFPITCEKHYAVNRLALTREQIPTPSQASPN